MFGWRQVSGQPLYNVKTLFSITYGLLTDGGIPNVGKSYCSLRKLEFRRASGPANARWIASISLILSDLRMICRSLIRLWLREWRRLRNQRNIPRRVPANI